MSARLGRSILAVASLCSISARAGAVRAEEGYGGVVRPAAPAGENWRAFLDALLFVPRKSVEIVVFTSSVTATFIEDQNIVPRTRDLLRSEDRKVHVTPTISLASGLRPDLGVRLTTEVGSFGSMLRTSIVGRDSFVTESRLLHRFGDGLTQLVVEGFQQRNGDGAFAGVGPDPLHDPRNRFLPGREGMPGLFLEKRMRLIASLASRVGKDIELLASASFQRREIEDPRGQLEGTINYTFAPLSVPGAYAMSDRAYGEATIRLDTRAVRGPPAAGTLLEGYAGASADVHGNFASAFHTGARAAGFISIVRPTTIISPRFAIDAIAPFGDGDLPFREYSYASGFRGPDGRVDKIAAVASVDYRWQLAGHVAARLFVDTTTVAPKVSALRLDHLVWAVGGGIDIHTSTTEIGRIGLVYSAQSISLLLVYGLGDFGFGDRQHR